MPLPVINNAFRTISRWSNVASGNPWSVTLDYIADSPVDADAVGAEIVTRWQDLFNVVISANTVANIFNEDVQLQDVVVYDLSTLVAPAIANAVPLDISGASATALPPDVALVISKRTAFRGRSGRGRIYLGGLSQAIVDTDTGFTEAAFQTPLVDNFALQFQTVVVGSATLDLGVITQAQVPTGEFRQVTNITSDNSFDTQRRRGVR